MMEPYGQPVEELSSSSTGEDSTDPTKSAFGDPVDVKGIVESILKEEV